MSSGSDCGSAWDLYLETLIRYMEKKYRKSGLAQMVDMRQSFLMSRVQSICRRQSLSVTDLAEIAVDGGG